MADVELNAAVWDSDWDWSSAGDEWSGWWGGTPAMWHGALLPRLHSFVPAGTVLEIAPGYGRWTQYLKDLCERLVIVDLAERCIESCRRRFEDATNIEYHVNDGRSLDMVSDGSVDLAFSFDSLVHAEADVLGAYLQELARVLAPDGVGILHHSVLGEYPRLTRLAYRTPEPVRRRLTKRGLMIDLYAWRAESVTAARFAQLCREAGLACVSQEKITWEHGPFTTDALSVFTRPGSRWERQPRVWRSRGFRAEASRMSRLYADSSFR